MAKPLFGICKPLSVSGIKQILLATKKIDGSVIEYPIDYIISKIDNSIILGALILSPTQQIALSSDLVYDFIRPYSNTANFYEEEIKDKQGTYYKQRLSLGIPKITLEQNKELKLFLIDNQGEYSIANAFIILVDNNDVNWIMGYEQPMILQNIELGTDDNSYLITFESKSYSRIRRFEIGDIVLPQFHIVPTSHDFGSFISGDNPSVNITIFNDGNTAINVGVTQGGANFFVDIPPTSIPANGQLTVQATALSVNDGSHIETTIFSAGYGVTQDLVLQSTVIAANYNFTLVPTSYDFGTIPIN